MRNPDSGAERGAAADSLRKQNGPGARGDAGRVTEGMEVAEQIAKDARPIDSNGTIPPEQQPVIEKEERLRAIE